MTTLSTTTEVYKLFTSQLSAIKSMAEITKKYQTQLEEMVNQNNIILLRALAGDDYITELHRSQLSEKLYLIFEELSLTAEQKYIQQYRESQFVITSNRRNNKIKSCADCGGSFSADCDLAEFICTKCGRIEIIDGAAFTPEQFYNNKQMKKISRSKSIWPFKYCLDHILGNESLTKIGNKNDPKNLYGEKLLARLREEITRQNILPTSLTIDKLRQLLRDIGRTDLFKFSTLIFCKISGINPPSLTHEQHEHIIYVFSCISDYLPKYIYYPFLIYKILDLILPEGPQREILTYIKIQKPSTNRKNERHWRSDIRAAGIIIHP